MSDEILDSVLDLEDASYQAGFDEGKADGAEAGYTEGKIFGIERGYQKALEMGKLHGRALMLNACLSDPNPIPEHAISPSVVATDDVTASESRPDDGNTASGMPSLPSLPENPRLKKHIETLLRLTDILTLSVENSDKAVDEFDDRMKKAIAKAKVIDKLIADPYNLTVTGYVTEYSSQPAAVSGNIEELGNAAVRR